MKEITLTNEELSIIRDGDYVIKKWNNMLYLKIEEYTISDKIADDTGEDEIIFESDMKIRKRNAKDT